MFHIISRCRSAGVDSRMATTGEAEVNLERNNALGSNNLYLKQRPNDSEEAQQELLKEQQRLLDSEKQVVSNEANSGPDNAPMVVEIEAPQQSRPEPIREADKEVISSWQSKSQEESAPIPMEHHESREAQGTLLNDVKGPPPNYDSIDRQISRENDNLITTPTAIEPDGSSSSLLPRAEDRSAVGQLLAWIPLAPRSPPSQMQLLFQPVIIPQLDVPPEGESVPFARCYSDALATHDVSMRDFTAFLDGLAVAQAPNSALQGLKMFGVGARSILIPLIPLAGRGIAALATSGSGHSGSRARLYLERAKKEYFASRGLRLSIVKDNDLNTRLGIPAHAFRLAPLTKNTLTDTLRTRRLEGLAPYVAPLRFDVPEEAKEIQGVHKMARKHLEHRIRDQSKRLKTMREKQWEEVSVYKLEKSRWDERYAAKMSEIRQLQDNMIREQRTNASDVNESGALREMAEELQERQTALQILISERQTAMQRPVDRSQGVEAEMQEVNWSRRLKWIVIENLQ